MRRINDEPFDVASVPGSRAVTIKFIIPNSRMGSVCVAGGVLALGTTDWIPALARAAPRSRRSRTLRARV